MPEGEGAAAVGGEVVVAAVVLVEDEGNGKDVEAEEGKGKDTVAEEEEDEEARGSAVAHVISLRIHPPRAAHQMKPSPNIAQSKDDEDDELDEGSRRLAEGSDDGTEGRKGKPENDEENAPDTD